MKDENIFDLQQFSKNLRELRKKAGLKQKDFARELGISAASLSAYELGQKMPSFKVLTKICESSDLWPLLYKKSLVREVADLWNKGNLDILDSDAGPMIVFNDDRAKNTIKQLSEVLEYCKNNPVSDEVRTYLLDAIVDCSAAS